MGYPQKLGITQRKVVEKPVKNPESDKELGIFLDIYPKKSADLPNIRPVWNGLIDAGVYPSDLQQAAARYTAWKQGQKKTSKYYKLPQNFLSDGFWLDFVPAARKDCPKCRGTRYLECMDPGGNPAVTECSCIHRYDDLRWRDRTACR